MVANIELTHAAPPVWDRQVKKARRFLRSPKGYLLVALVALAIPGAVDAGGGALSVLLWAVLGAAGMELVLVRLRGNGWRIPSSALLTGLITGMVLGPAEPWYAALGAGVLATDAKHLLRAGRTHIFNPAAAGLVAVYLLFGTGHSWWGALAELPAWVNLLALLPYVLVAERANKLPAAMTFLCGYFGLFAVAAFFQPELVAEHFRQPFLAAALYFAFFMVTDPPTSPVPFHEQAWFGALTAFACFAIFEMTGAVYFLPAGLLVANAVYAARRVAGSGQRAARGTRVAA